MKVVNHFCAGAKHIEHIFHLQIIIPGCSGIMLRLVAMIIAQLLWVPLLTERRPSYTEIRPWIRDYIPLKCTMMKDDINRFHSIVFIKFINCFFRWTPWFGTVSNNNTTTRLFYHLSQVCQSDYAIISYN